MLRPFLVAVLLLAARGVTQEAPFQSPLLHAGDFPLNATAGDLDGDGLTDVVVNNGSDLTVLLQGPLASFQPEISQPSVDFIDRMLLADLDADGDLDLGGVVDSGLDIVEALGVQLGGGDGTFGDPVLYPAGKNPYDIDVGDLDEDGAPDLAIANSSTPRVSLFFGLGDGSFAPKVDIAPGGAPRSLAIGHADGDAHLDLVISTGATELVTLLGTGGGAFAAQPATGMGQTATDLDFGDFDADGSADLVAAFPSALLMLVHGHGDGTWTVFDAIPTQSTTLRAVLADVDEDGADDVVCLLTDAFAIPEVSGFGVLLIDGAGGVGPMARYGTSRDPTDLVVADLSHDGELDLLAPLPQSFVPANVMLLHGRGDGTFGPVLKTGDAPEELVAGDLDGDGLEDLVVACGKSDAVAVHRGLGHGAFDAAAPLVPTGDFPVGVDVADIVEDGLPDIVVANRHNPGQVRVLPGDGRLGFGPDIISLPGMAPYGMATGDANLDGHLDVALPGDGNKAAIALGDGAGHFAVVDTVAATSVSPDAAAFGDLDSDGLPDLVIANASSAFVDTALGLGAGQFGPTTSVAAPSSNQHDVALGDIDGDLDLDVVVPGGFWGMVCVYLNDGGGDLVLHDALPSPDPMAVALGDMDGNGLVDVVATTDTAALSAAYGALTVWPQTAGGGFGPPQDVLTGGSTNFAPQELLVRDLDGDGALDAAVLVLEDDDLWLLPNRTGPWQDLGQPLAGAQGLPREAGFGTLQPGAPFEIRLTDSQPGGLAAHVIGLSVLEAPFKGGVFVPDPLVIVYPLPLDAQGDLSLVGNWPGPAASGVSLYFQFWTADPAGVKGWSASNALQATLP